LEARWADDGEETGAHGIFPGRWERVLSSSQLQSSNGGGTASGAGESPGGRISRLPVASGARSAGQQSGTGVSPVDARQAHGRDQPSP
jgi:hypothetical protein